MAAKDWVIVWLSIQITALSIYATKQSYVLGYEQGRLHVLTTFEDPAEGTCLADKPIHRGPCK